MWTIDQLTFPREPCRLSANLFINIDTSTPASRYYLLAPILTFSFGLLPIADIRRRSARTRPLRRSINPRRTEGQ